MMNPTAEAPRGTATVFLNVKTDVKQAPNTSMDPSHACAVSSAPGTTLTAGVSPWLGKPCH